jgi:serine/threonine-protein kinase
VVAYECLTGRRPFDGNTPVSVALAQVREEPPALPPGIPDPVTDLVMRMLAKDPDDRPGTADLGREALAVRAGADAWGDAATRALPVADASATRRIEPAAGPAGRGSNTDPGFLLPPLRSRPSWLPYAIAAAVVLVLLLATVRACGGPDTEPTGSTSSSATQEDTDTVTVDQADYVGRPLDSVRADLTELGLVVQVEQTDGEGDAGTVTEVSPDGTLAPGDEVTVTAVRAADPGDEDDEEDDGKGKGKKKKKND